MRNRFLIMTLASSLLAACASQQAAQAPAQGVTMSTQGATLVQGGVVTDVRDVTVRGGGSGLGSVVGGILGGIAGSQIGGGTGSAVASVGGALAGGVAGQRVEQDRVQNTATEVTVRLDSGEERNYRTEPGDTFRIGEPVRIVTSQGIARVTR
ncbi:glycine zipper 2TM domain-containing protein [Noviherbaspirillum galbum]|uniref:Glycine zipper 2TM domain-containing protein n=1 Tax=Noviherbaspirillum galbum TaxID=2709383 RepID=A0A6B3SV98_9BURK|nr:glycine zipper 2TM domain-containing protein [Noviherbaspirillum galbum]NEX64438.1 glycine zipper 2TM domain-containing protein [Noviherbaspirillum galbum]